MYFQLLDPRSQRSLPRVGRYSVHPSEKLSTPSPGIVFHVRKKKKGQPSTLRTTTTVACAHSTVCVQVFKGEGMDVGGRG